MGWCSCSVMKEKKVVWGVCFLLLLNIAVPIAVISLLSSQENHSLEKRSPHMSRFTTFVDKIYEDIREGSFSMPRNPGEGDKQPSLEFLSLLKPIAHLSGLDFLLDRTDATGKTSVVRNWAIAEGSERTLLYNGMKYEMGSVIVPAPGSYIVNSHVKFYVENNKKDGSVSSFKHIVYKFNVFLMREEIVFLNDVTECIEGINDGAHLEYPSDIRGVVYLNAGDHVTVIVSNTSLLRHDRDWHYFGIYLI